MSDNTSDSPGFLLPTSAPIPYDDELLDLLQPSIVGITGLPGSMVRPSYQPDDTPNMPDFDANWAGFRISATRADTFSYEAHSDDGDGYDSLEFTEELDLQASFYGLNCRAYAEQFRAGIQVEQNRAGLDSLGIALISIGNALTLPALVTGKWQRRIDVTVYLRRYLVRRYGVLTILLAPNATLTSPGAGINNEQYVEPIYVRQAPQ